jgi:flagellar biosynthesis chaperone FliJ
MALSSEKEGSRIFTAEEVAVEHRKLMAELLAVAFFTLLSVGVLAYYAAALYAAIAAQILWLLPVIAVVVAIGLAADWYWTQVSEALRDLAAMDVKRTKQATEKHDRAIAPLAGEKQRLEQQLGESKEEVAELQRQLAQVRQEKEATEQKSTAASSISADVTAELAALRKQVDGLQGAVLKEQGTSAELRKALNRTKAAQRTAEEKLAEISTMVAAEAALPAVERAKRALAQNLLVSPTGRVTPQSKRQHGSLGLKISTSAPDLSSPTQLANGTGAVGAQLPPTPHAPLAPVTAATDGDQAPVAVVDGRRRPDAFARRSLSVISAMFTQPSSQRATADGLNGQVVPGGAALPVVSEETHFDDLTTDQGLTPLWQAATLDGQPFQFGVEAPQSQQLSV